MEKRCDPRAIEEKWRRFWTERDLSHGDSARGGTPYCVMIPPPNVTGVLHMGHALNNTIQDILARWRRMQGRNTVWVPGTDHAGIATQNVVERALQDEGKTRDDLGREAFIARVWDWKKQYGSTIISQLKKLGASCDWARERFTMDEGLSNAVTEVFARLYDKGLIYRGQRIVNWCPRCRTALSDEESEHAEETGRLWHIRYPVLPAGRKAATPPKSFIVVATTRPETLLGDTAVAVNPRDPRYRNLDKKRIVLPVLGRELKVIRDDFVAPEFGTGIVKVTPAHDPNDFAMGRRHGLAFVNIMNGDGTMNEEAGPYQGLDRFECRKKILVDLEKQGLLEKVEEHRHAVGHCYRCDTVVEPRLSAQWFVKMKPLAAPAIEAVKSGKVTFTPARWTKVYLEWMENIRDWCISRQIWWGHRIPVFSCEGCGKEWAARGRPGQCPKCGGADIRQDEDVLDTWFSSWLWPFSALGWPERNPDMAFYYPTNDLVTASEIIFFWVARMIMAGLEFMGDVPFTQVYIHGTVRDDKGRKMSKSLGNSIDPLDVIEKFSADALRFSLMMLTATGQDVFLSDEKFELGRNFGTKLWNAARLMRMRSGDRPPPPQDRAPDFAPERLGSDDRHILARLQEAVAVCTANLAGFRFNDAAHALYEFVWRQYCDWYVEYAKDILCGQDAARKDETLKVMHYVFATALKLLHPTMPFITEELWHAMGYGGENDSIMVAAWPKPEEAAALARWGADPGTVEYVDEKHNLIRLGRALKADYEIPATREVEYLIKPSSAKAAERLKADEPAIRLALKASRLMIDASFEPAKVMASGVGKLGAIYMPLEGLIDVEREKKRLSDQLAKVDKALERVSVKLQNLDFLNKAKPEVVENQKAQKQELLEKSEKHRHLLRTLAGLEKRQGAVFKGSRLSESGRKRSTVES
ncbi:MAG: valine--tRNA ligase [Verrucomicrobiota bacterium]|nr:valine--tRNA ligase [Verrucomicrobiota bacterium]